MSGERVVRRAELHWMMFVPHVLLMMIGIGFVTILFPIIRQWTTEFAVTTRRIVAKEGWLARRTIELNFDKVESVGVDQGVIGRLLNYGTIIVTASGGTREIFPHVADPMALRKAVQEVSHG